MASGNGDPIYGQPYTGTIVTRTDTFPLVQTVLNMSRGSVSETITRTANDDHYTTEGNAQAAGDLYHE